MKPLPNWNEWIPRNGIEILARALLIEKPLWIRKDFFERLVEEGYSSDDWFDKGMHRNEDADKTPLWPWISFQAESSDINLIFGERYIRRRPSWKPLNNAIDTSDAPHVTTIKEILSIIEQGLPIAQNLHPRKLAQIVIGNFERTRDRLRNELDHLHHDWRTQ